MQAAELMDSISSKLLLHGGFTGSFDQALHQAALGCLEGKSCQQPPFVHVAVSVHSRKLVGCSPILYPTLPFQGQDYTASCFSGTCICQVCIATMALRV